MILPYKRDRNQTDRDVTLDPRLLTELRAAYRRSPPLDDVDDAIRRAMAARVVQHETSERGVRGRHLLPRLGVAVAAFFVFALGLGIHLHSQSPGPVLAQTIFREAATAGMAPNRITAFVYRVTNTGGRDGAQTGSVRFWVLSNGRGQPERLGYDASPFRGGVVRYLVGTYEDIVGQNVPASLSGKTVAGQQAFGGYLCDLVRAPSGARFYFDVQTHVLRGADWTDSETSGPQAGPDTTWHAELSSFALLPASAKRVLPLTIEPNGFRSSGGNATKSSSKSRSPKQRSKR